MKKQYLLAACALLTCLSSLWAQQFTENNYLTKSYEEQIVHVFEHFDMNQVTSNILLDAGYRLSPDSSFDASPTCAPGNYMFWKMTYLSLYTSQLSIQMEDPSLAMADFLDVATYENNRIPLGLIDYFVHRIKPDAEDNGDINVTNGQLYNVTGKNPFEQLRVFTMSPLVNEVKGNSLSFTFPAANLFSNVDYGNGSGQNPISSLEIDADDGQGYRVVSLSTGNTGMLTAADFAVDYSQPGTKTIAAKVRFFGDPQVYHAKAKIQVNFSVAPPKSNGTTQAFPKVDGVHSGGEINIQYGCGSKGYLTKPFIYVEGFDIYNSISDDDFERKFSQQIVSSGLELGSEMIDNGYDLIYVNFNNATDDIRRNAALLREILLWINARKEENRSEEPNVVMGESMGGMVARYALRKMELDGEDHHTDTYISFDSPHNGANIPVGIQALLGLIFDASECIKVPFDGKKCYDLNDFDPVFQQAMDALNSTAARQMLKVRPGTLASLKSSLYNDFYGEINHPDFGMPRKTKNLALSNGSIDGVHYNGFNPREKLVHIDIRRKDIVDELANLSPFWKGVLNAVLTASSTFGRLQADAWASSNYPNIEHKVARLKVKASFLLVPVFWINRELSITQGNINLDNAPGGLYNVGAVTGEIDGLPGTVEVNTSHFSFIPTNSAMGITGNDANNFYFDIRDEQPEITGKSLFTGIEGPKYTQQPNVDNEAHVDLSIGGAAFLASHLLREVDDLENVYTLTGANSYNFGINANYEAKRRLGHPIVVESGAYIGVNADEPLGYVADNNGLPEVEHITVETRPCPEIWNVNLTIRDGGTLKIGNTAKNLSGKLIFNSQSGLILEQGAILHIAENSQVFISEESSLELAETSRIIIEPGGSLVVEGEFTYTNNTAPFEVNGGGEFRLAPSNNFTLAIGNTNTLILDDGSQLLIDGGAELTYQHDGEIILNGAEAMLEIRSQLNIAPGADFTFGSSPGQATGYLRLNPNNKESWISIGTGSRFILPETGVQNTSLQIAGNTHLTGDFGSNRAYFDEIVLRNTRIEILEDAWLFTMAPYWFLTGSYVIGGGQLMVHRNEAQTSDFGGPAADGQVFRGHEINTTTFDDVTVSHSPGQVSSFEALQIEECTFKNEASALDLGLGMNIIDCAFEDVSFYRSISSKYPSRVVNSVFNGNNTYGSRAMTVNNSYTPISITRNTVNNYGVGLLGTIRATTLISCNILENNIAGYAHAALSDAVMTGVNNEGHNYIVNNEHANIVFSHGNYIPLDNGNNAFFNDQFQAGDRYIFAGTIPSHQYSCLTPQAENYPATRNQWSSTNVLAKPQNMPMKFALNYQNQVNCNTCRATVIDELPQELTACPRNTIGVDPVDELLDDLLSGNSGFMGGEANVLCPNCPIISTDYFKATPLNRAIAEAQSHNANADHELALELFRQILTYPYADKSASTYRWLKLSYTYAKLAVGHLLQANKAPYVALKMNAIHDSYHPADYASATRIDQFNYAFDQASLQLSTGPVEEALEEMNRMVEQTSGRLQEALQEHLEFVERQYEHIEGLLPLDELIEELEGLVGQTPLGDVDTDLPCVTLVGDWGMRAQHEINDEHQLHDWTRVTETHQSGNGSAAKNGKQLAMESTVFKVRPNPANNQLIVETKEWNEAKIQLVSLTGEVVYKKQLKDTASAVQLTIDVSHLAPGVYFVQCIGSQETEMKRVVIAH